MSSAIAKYSRSCHLSRQVHRSSRLLHAVDLYASATYCEPAKGLEVGCQVATQRWWKLLSYVIAALQGLYDIEVFRDFCILYETSAQCGTYLKGWGFMVVPAFGVAVSRSVHISAPHPGYNLGTVEQAASIFENTGSKSLLVPGRTRTAFLKSPDCIVPVSARQDYYMTDPAHNNVRFFRWHFVH